MRPFLIPLPPENRIAKFLLYASKTDPNRIAPCSWRTVQTQIAKGVFVSVTALASLGSAACTLSTFNAPMLLIPVFAAVWGTFVFFVDREIVSAHNKKTIWVRLLLAALIGTLTSIPVEMQIFKPEIDVRLERDYNKANKHKFEEQDAREKELKEDRKQLERKLQNQQDDAAHWGGVMDAEAGGHPGAGRTGQPGIGPSWRTAQQQQELVEQMIAQTRAEIDKFDRSLPEERERLEKKLDYLAVPKETGFMKRYEALEHVSEDSPSIAFLHWLLRLVLIMVEMTPAIMKSQAEDSDYDALERAGSKESRFWIDRILNGQMERLSKDPETPQYAVEDLYTTARHAPPQGEPQEDNVEPDAFDEEDEDRAA